MVDETSGNRYNFGMSITSNERVVAEIRAEIARQQRRRSDLMNVLGVSQSGISARLSGKTDLTLDELFLISDWLGVDPADWFTAKVAS